MKDLISVIVPVYNVQHFLPKCIESLISQSYPDLQIILIDDGSTDSSGKICDRYASKDARIEVVHQQNLGPSAARNRGLRLADGKYIIFCDSDDWMSKNGVRTLYECMRETDADISFGEIVLILPKADRRLQGISDRSYRMSDPEELIELFGSINVGPCAKLFKSDMISRLGLSFDENHAYAEDKLFLFQYLRECKCAASVSDDVYYYNQLLDHSLTRKYHPEAGNIIFRGEKMYNEILDQRKDGIHDALIDTARSRHNTKMFLWTCYSFITNQDDPEVAAAKISDVNKLYGDMIDPEMLNRHDREYLNMIFEFAEGKRTVKEMIDYHKVGKNGRIYPDIVYKLKGRAVEAAKKAKTFILFDLCRKRFDLQL